MTSNIHRIPSLQEFADSIREDVERLNGKLLRASKMGLRVEIVPHPDTAYAPNVRLTVQNVLKITRL